MMGKNLKRFLKTANMEQKIERYKNYQRLFNQSRCVSHRRNLKVSIDDLKHHIMTSPEFLNGAVLYENDMFKLKQKTIGETINLKLKQTISTTSPLKKAKMEVRQKVIGSPENIIQLRYGSLIKSASKRGIKVKLTLKQFAKLCEQTHCAYTGVKFINGDENFGFSVDRIDSTKGYSKNNVVACTIQANLLKEHLIESGDMFSSPNDLFKFAQNIMIHSK